MKIAQAINFQDLYHHTHCSTGVLRNVRYVLRNVFANGEQQVDSCKTVASKTSSTKNITAIVLAVTMYLMFGASNENVLRAVTVHVRCYRTDHLPDVPVLCMLEGYGDITGIFLLP